MTYVVAFYVDYGRPYAPLFERMTESVRNVIPDAKLILITGGAPQEIMDRFDKCYHIGPVDSKILCHEKARAIVSWAVKADEPTIFVDPDIEFRAEPEWDCDIGLMWRENKPDQPINAGYILAKPGQEKFWRHYGKILVNLPDAIKYWWCDQIAFALLTGVCHRPEERLKIHGSTVRLIDAEKFCPNDDKEGAWAIHYKGRRKGPGWERVFVDKAPA